ALTFPDGARREYPKGSTGLDIAKQISPSLAKRTIAMAVDGVLADLSDPIERDAKIEFLTRDDPRALELIRHDAAHVLAEAVQTLWPGTQVTIGPVIENGFYYDFFRNQPFAPEDFDAIEKKMREIIARDKPFTKEIWTREQAKRVFRDKRDHRRLGREMDLFHFQEEAPGSVFWHPKGWTLYQILESYIRRRQAAAGYVEVNSPQLMDSSLWVASGHMATFRENMFLTQPREDDERTFIVKPMNCPGHIQIFKNGLKSYRDLPFKLAEFGKVHRFEPSGALHGLMRVRAFTQDDAHVFVTEGQIAAEALAMNDLILSIYEDFGFPDVTIKFSDRPDKRIGED